MTKQEALQELMDLSIDYGTRTADEIERLDEAVDMAIKALRADAVDSPTCDDAVKSHSEKQILEGCIALIDEMVGYFREYLDFVDFTPEYDEEKQPFCMSYFHIVNRLFLWHTSHCGGTSTRAKCHELGIDDSSETVKFELWEDEEEEEQQND